MALSLKELSNKKKQNALSQEDRIKPTRPWESKRETAQSFAGNIAVKKAREIVEKNNSLVQDIRSVHACPESLGQVEKYIKEREDSFDNLVAKGAEVQKINTARGVLGKFKRAFLRS